jgi:putative transcriptional regulator
MSRHVAALALLGWHLLTPLVHVKDAKPPDDVSPTEPAKGRFLVASHRLADPNFFETVVLLLAYEAAGAIGVVINRPTDVPLGSVLRDVEGLRDRPEPLYLGGPVARNVLLALIRAAQQPESSRAIFDGVYVSGSHEALRKALGDTGKKNRVRVYAGYAAWGPGQLDREIAHGDWHVAAADATTVFDMKAPAIWPKLIQGFSGEWTRREAPDDARTGRCRAGSLLAGRHTSEEPSALRESSMASRARL